jgi:membrane associated rhomboid family serine protease
LAVNAQPNRRLTHREKVERQLADMVARGVSSYTAAPPLFRLLWALGVPVPPPLFLGFTTLTLLMGTFFAVIWGGLMWLLVWPGAQLLLVATTAAIAGLVFGVCLAAYVRWQAARLQIPPWESYTGH